MPSVTCTIEVEATPEKIWSVVFAPMRWEEWDPDVLGIANHQGGLANGATFDFMMKTGFKSVSCTLSDVIPCRSVTFSGSAMLGLMGFSGTVLLNKTRATTTTISYTFGMSGCLGEIITIRDADGPLGGTQRGLDNMVAMIKGEPLPFP